MIKPALGSVVAIALEIEIASGFLRVHMFETALVPMLTETHPEVLADFWIIVVCVVARIAVVAVTCLGKLHADIGSDSVRERARVLFGAGTCLHVF